VEKKGFELAVCASSWHRGKKYWADNEKIATPTRLLCWTWASEAKGCGFHPSNNRHVPYQSLTKMPLAEEITQ